MQCNFTPKLFAPVPATAAVTRTFATATAVLLGRGRDVLTLRAGLRGHLVVVALVLLASALGAELAPVVLERRRVIRQNQK